MKKISKISLLLLFSLALFSCKKTVESETSNWKDNKKKVNELQATYPAFASVLDTEMKDAQQKWDEAAKITKEENKIKKMSEANYTFDKGFVYDLSSLGIEVDKVTRKNKEILNDMVSGEVKLGESDKKLILLINEDTQKALSDVDKVLSRGDKSAGQATKTIKEANKNLLRIEEKLNEASEIINKSRTAKKNTKKTTKDDEKVVAKDTVKKVKKKTETSIAK